MESDKSICDGVKVSPLWENKRGKLRPGLQLSRRFWSVRRLLQALVPVCAVTCTDASGPVFTPSQLQPAGGVKFHQTLTRDITDTD